MYVHSLNSLELSKLGQIRKQAAIRHISSLRDTTILAMSNMLTANIDSGLTHTIGETAPQVLIIITYLGETFIWVGQFCILLDTILFFETIVLYYTACSHNVFMVLIFY